MHRPALRDRRLKFEGAPHFRGTGRDPIPPAQAGTSLQHFNFFIQGLMRLLDRRTTFE
jgi:hypothetical protein